MPSAINRLTDEDIAVLWSFKRHVGGGVRWKGKLRHCWERGVYPYNIPANTKAHLRHMRNTLGTSWLARFKFPTGPIRSVPNQTTQFPRVCRYCGKTTCPRAKDYLEPCEGLVGSTDPDCSD